MPARSRPDLPRIEECRPGDVKKFCLVYGGSRGWAKYETRKECLLDLDSWLAREMDQMILYLDELRRLSNRVTKELKESVVDE